jgi:hypothetical protein
MIRVSEGSKELGNAFETRAALDRLRAYICFLLVRTLYFRRSHNIKFLGSLAEDSEARPSQVAAATTWPHRGRRV